MIKINVEEHLGLIHSVLKNLSWTYSTKTNEKGDVIRVNNNDSSLDYNDLFQEGYFGLVKAAETYKEDISKFSVHAYMWIRQAIIRAYNTQHHAIRKPDNEHTTYYKIRRFQETYFKKYNTAASVNIIADRLNLEVNHINDLLNTFTTPTSLDSTITFKDSEMELSEVIEDESFNYTEVDYKLELERLKNDFEQMFCDLLTPIETQVIKLFYGWNNDRLYSSKEISLILNIDNKEVPLLQRKAIRKLNKKIQYLKSNYKDLINNTVDRMPPYMLKRNELLVFERVLNLIKDNNIKTLNRYNRNLPSILDMFDIIGVNKDEIKVKNCFDNINAIVPGNIKDYYYMNNELYIKFKQLQTDNIN